eukprot:SM000981S25188  [mRNA]  locus=s981:1267:2187:- [translate_table: standard]
MGFMMWMAGNTLHIFSIGIVASALWQPLSALRAVAKVFEPFKDPRTDTTLPTLLYVALHLVGLGLGLYKVRSALRSTLACIKPLPICIFEAQMLWSVPRPDLRREHAHLQLHALGLLPTHASDWISTLPPPHACEFSAGGLPLT